MIGQPLVRSRLSAAHRESPTLRTSTAQQPVNEPLITRQRLTFPFPFVHHQQLRQREGREHLWNLNLGSDRQELIQR